MDGGAGGTWGVRTPAAWLRDCWDSAHETSVIEGGCGMHSPRQHHSRLVPWEQDVARHSLSGGRWSVKCVSLK